MARYIRKERLRSAIISLAEWRAATQAQGSMHLFPFLALLKKGINADNLTLYEESDDYDFFDAHFRVPGDEKTPYFDPLVRKRRIATHPHSNVATARKGTFEKSWGAATSEIENGNTYWQLANDFDDTVRRKVMTRGGETTRANVLDVAVWLFRNEEFPDNADATSLQQRFRDTFSMSDEVYNKLFEINDEPAENIFTNTPIAPAEMEELIGSLEITKAKAKPKPVGPSKEIKSELEEDDPILQEVRAVLDMGTSGMILRGCPGTSKSWYAWNIALDLTDNDPERIKRVQFHPSYGYEDFVEGYRPAEDKKSGFDIVDRSFLDWVRKANDSEDTHVYIIDEINRGDPSRVFGEVLTYIEEGWRGVDFTLPYSGKNISVPRNLIIIATMNQHDRSITQLDMAMLRRFDHIDVHPSKERVAEFLSNAGMEEAKTEIIVEWFDNLQGMLNPVGIGHTYFLNVANIGRMSQIWRYRILPFCESVLEFEQDRLEDVKRSYNAMHKRLLGQKSGE